MYPDQMGTFWSWQARPKVMQCCWSMPTFLRKQRIFLPPASFPSLFFLSYLPSPLPPSPLSMLGGLLSAYDLSGDDVFLSRARQLGDRLLPAFNTPTGIPRMSIDLKSGFASGAGWTGVSGSGSGCVSEGQGGARIDTVALCIRKSSVTRRVVMELSCPIALPPMHLSTLATVSP